MIIFDDMIGHVISCKKAQQKLNNKREMQNIAINHSADIDYEDFINIYRNCTKEPFNFLTIDTALNKLFKNFNEPLSKNRSRFLMIQLNKMKLNMICTNRM